MKRIGLFLITTFIVQLSFGQNGSFRSITSGNWSTPATWERDPAGGTNYTDSPSSLAPSSTDGTIIIQSPHTVTVTTSLSTDQTTVQTGGILTINLSQTLTIATGSGDDLTVDAGGILNINGTLAITSSGGIGSNADVSASGTINNNGLITGSTSNARITFTTGALYDHQVNAGTVPTAIWDTGSTCQISGSTSAGPTSGFDQSFADFIWNTPLLNTGSGVMDMGLTSSSVFGGNFSIVDTGNDALVLTNTASTIVANGNFTVSGSSSFAITDVVVGTVTLDVAGDFTHSSSATSFFSGGASATGNLNVAGDFIFSDGSIIVNNLSGGGTLTLDGSSAQSYTDTGGTFAASVNDADIVIANSSDVQIVGNGAFDGSGDFTVESGATLRLGSTHSGGALQDGTAFGNVQMTGAKSYTGGVTIIYNGSAAQTLGNDFPLDVNLTVNNAAGVSLTSGTTIAVTRTLNLLNGNLGIASNLLTLNGNLIGTGFLIGGLTSDLTITGTGNFGTIPFTGTTILNDLIINRTSSGTVTLGGDLTIGSFGSFTQTEGDLILNGRTLTIGGNYTKVNAGNLVCDASASLIINGAGTLPALVSLSGPALNTFTLDRSGGTFTTTNSLTITNLNLNSGIFDNLAFTMADAGVLTRQNGTMITTPSVTGSYDVVYNNGIPISSGPELPTNSTDLGNLTTQGSALTVGNAITVNGTLTVGGVFDPGLFDLTLGGNLVTNATVDFASNEVIFAGTTAISGTVAPTFSDISLTGTLTPNATFNITGNLVNNGILNTGSGTVVFAGNTTISGANTSSFNNINITGTLTADVDDVMSVGGTFAINGGTFNHNNSTVNFNGTTTFSGTAPNLNDITIAGSSTLTAPSGTLNIAGDMANAGTFNANNGIINLNGSGTQTISGAQTWALNDLTINNTSATISNNGIVSISSSGTLTMGANSTLDADGTTSGIFRLLSTSASASATVAELGSGAGINGNVRWQRYFDGGGDVWRNFGVPLSNATIADIQDDNIGVSGSFTGADAGAANLYYYDEMTGGDVDQGFVAYPTTTNAATLTNNRGYTFFTRTEDAGIPGTMELTGELNTGQVDFGVTYTDDVGQPASEDGWHLINNPYAATIDWATNVSDWTKTNVGNVAQLWDTSAGAYVALNGSGLIAPGQAIWIQTTASSPSLIIQESAKSTGGTFQRPASVEVDHLLISLIQGAKIDMAHIQFKENAINELDLLYDGVKLKNNIYNLSTKASTGEKLIVNSMAPLQECVTVNIPMVITDIDPGSYQYVFDDVSSFSGLGISLVDNFVNVTVVLTEGYVYEFDVTSDEASFGDARFELIFSESSVNTDLTSSAIINCDDQFISINIEDSQNGFVYTLVNGTEEIATTVGNGGQVAFQIQKTLLTEGANTLDMTIESPTCGNIANADNQIVFNYESINEVTAIAGGSNCGIGSVTISAEGASENGQYNWYESIDAVEPIANQNTSSFTTPLLQTSTTYFVAIVNVLGCESITRIPVDVVINELPDTPEISADGTLLVSSSDVNNQWYKDGEIIVGATGSTYEVAESGSYTVTVENSSGCEATSQSIELTITAIVADGFGDDNIRISPNPVGNEELTISLSEDGLYENMLLYNSQGKLMMNQEIDSDSEIQINMSRFKKGVYFIHLTGDKGIAVHKILKN